MEWGTISAQINWNINIPDLNVLSIIYHNIGLEYHLRADYDLFNANFEIMKNV